MASRKRYKVERWCCKSGRCTECVGQKGKRRIVQLDGLWKAEAEAVAHNWKEYEAKVVEEGEDGPDGIKELFRL